jgi:hypothetical protein
MGEYHSMAELLAEFPDGAEQDEPAIEDVEFMGLLLKGVAEAIEHCTWTCMLETLAVPP